MGEAADRRVVVTGAGVLAAGAASADDLAGIAGGGEMPPPVEITAFEVPEGAPEVACELTDFEITDYLDSIKSYIDRTSALACAAAKLALDDGGFGSERPAGIGLAYATAWGCLDSMELFFHKVAEGNPRLAPPLPFSHSYANSPAAVLAIEFGLQGFHTVASTGWNSATIALGEAVDAVRSGACEAVVAGGSESGSLARFRHLLGKGHLGEGGAVFGEGACMLVLEEADAAADRGSRASAEVLGWATSNGGDPADAVRRALVAACSDAGIEPGALAGYSGCASGIERFDAAEVCGLAAACGIGEDEARSITASPYAATGLVEGPAGSFAAALAVMLAADRNGPVAAGTLDEAGTAAALVVAPAGG